MNLCSVPSQLLLTPPCLFADQLSSVLPFSAFNATPQVPYPGVHAATEPANVAAQPVNVNAQQDGCVALPELQPQALADDGVRPQITDNGSAPNKTVVASTSGHTEIPEDGSSPRSTRSKAGANNSEASNISTHPSSCIAERLSCPVAERLHNPNYALSLTPVTYYAANLLASTSTASQVADTFTMPQDGSA